MRGTSNTSLTGVEAVEVPWAELEGGPPAFVALAHSTDAVLICSRAVRVLRALAKAVHAFSEIALRVGAALYEVFVRRRENARTLQQGRAGGILD